jgi:hypothetical protein
MFALTAVFTGLPESLYIEEKAQAEWPTMACSSIAHPLGSQTERPNVGIVMKYLLLLIMLLTGCGPRWNTESITLPTGDVIKNRYRYSTGFQDTSYFGNWSIVWKSSGKEEGIPGYGGRLPSADQWTLYTNSGVFGFTIGNNIVWRDWPDNGGSWQRTFVRGTPSIYDCIKTHLDRNHPHDYKIDVDETEVIAITNGISYASHYIYIRRQYGIPPYRLISVDFNAKRLTLERERTTPCLPKYLILTNSTFSADIESWCAELTEDEIANQSVQATARKLAEPGR